MRNNSSNEGAEHHEMATFQYSNTLQPQSRPSQATDPFVRELFFADDLKPLPNIVADANTPPVVLLPGAMAMGGSVPAMPPGPPPMGAPGFPMMGGGMPMGPMGPMGPPGQMGGMGDFPMQMPMPPGGCFLRWDIYIYIYII